VFGGVLSLDSGDGADNVLVSTVAVGDRLSIFAATGPDRVKLNLILAINQISVDLGAGDSDVLLVAHSTSADAEFQGGGDPSDWLIRVDNQFAAETDSGFAHVI
jgi:hypothetical protein